MVRRRYLARVFFSRNGPQRDELWTRARGVTARRPNRGISPALNLAPGLNPINIHAPSISAGDCGRNRSIFAQNKQLQVCDGFEIDFKWNI